MTVLPERVLIVGLGSIGKRHLRIARETLPAADIRILRHQPCAEIPEFANGCFSSLDEACTFAPQVAVISNPAPFHLDVASVLAVAGCHLLIEKPLSHSQEGVQQLLQVAHKQGLVVQTGYNLRFLPSLEEFRNQIHSGAIGQVFSIRCEIGQYLPSWRPGTDYRQGVSARQDLGGGVLLELSHEMDYLRWIFGEVAWVSAWIGRLGRLEIDVEDTAHLILGFAPGEGAPVAALDLDFIRHDTTRRCTALGERGSLRWNGLTGEIEAFSAGSTAWQPVFHHAHQRDDSYRAQWSHFLDCVQGGLMPRAGGEDGLAVLRMIGAARQSAAKHGMQVAIAPLLNVNKAVKAG